MKQKKGTRRKYKNKSSGTQKKNELQSSSEK